MPDFIIHPHALLRQAATPRPVDATMIAAGEALLAAASEVSAYGLAAVHLGRLEPLVVVSVADDPALRDYRILYNPEVLAVADETAVGAEGSVSMPGIEAPVARAVWADIAFNDATGTRQTERFTGFVARVMLHEIDQMNGVFFLERVSRIKRDTALRKFAKSQR